MFGSRRTTRTHVECQEEGSLPFSLSLSLSLSLALNLWKVLGESVDEPRRYRVAILFPNDKDNDSMTVRFERISSSGPFSFPFSVRTRGAAYRAEP